MSSRKEMHLYLVFDDMYDDVIQANSATNAAIEFVARGSWPETSRQIECTVYELRDDTPEDVYWMSGAERDQYCTVRHTVLVDNPEYEEETF